MVGEIRDQETMDLAVQASLTGHLVFSTLHTNSAAGALPRLMDMGAKPFLLASSITCVMAQRVARTICPHCKKEYIPPPTVVADIKKVLGPLLDSWIKQSGKQGGQISLFKGEGCQACADTGYFGRMGIFEVLVMTDKIARSIVEDKSTMDLEKQAVDDGMILMKQDGYLKALEGITSIEEILRIADI
jgi:type II secretory ATPase GspE/PulE/Tfp pilus assembly ATPase PilB-like protein